MATNTGPAGARPEPREPRAEPRAPQARVEPRIEPRVEPRVESRTEARVAEPAVRTPAPEPKPVEVPAPRPSVLGPTLKFRGELSAKEDLIVQGSVEGTITHTQSLTIGTDGSMKGDIRARNIIIDGKVEGDLYATESVSIRGTAKVKGNIMAPRIAITDGAFFQGQIDMQPNGAAVQEQSRARQAAGVPASLDAPQVEKMLAGSAGG